MKYNNKNIKNFFWIKIFVLPLLFFVIATETFIDKVDILVNKETGQKIICLGDFHEHPAHWKGTESENITKTQQADIIALANKLHATILLEVVDLENIASQYAIKEFGRKIIPMMIKKLANTPIESVLVGLYTHSIANNIRCENVECRVSLNCFDSTRLFARCMTPQEVFDRAEQTAKKIAKFNDKEPFKKIYKEELDNFNTVYPMFKKFLNKLDKHGNIPINELEELIKNRQIILSDDALFALVNFVNLTMPIGIQIDTTAFNHSHLQPNEIGVLISSIEGFPDKFVDMHILHAIAQKKKIPIIVVTGSLHTGHIVKRLQQCGYKVKKSIGEDPEKNLAIKSFLYPSAVNLKMGFRNLEQVGYLRKINNFFRYSWNKIVTALCLCSIFYQIFW